jgi:hypothetical protein
MRTYTNIHLSRARQYGADTKGVDIHGRPRGPANTRGEI